MKLIDLLWQSRMRCPDRIAVIDEVCKLSYAELAEHVDRLSGDLRSVGCGPGVKVAIVLPNSAVYIACFFAISAVGATIVPLSSRMTVYEAAGFIHKADVSVVLTDHRFAAKLAVSLNGEVRISIVTIKQQKAHGDITFHIPVTGQIHCDEYNRDVALMVYTSGSTGASKIVMLTDVQLISNMLSYRAVMGFDRPHTVYCSLLLHHIYTICAQILTHISLGDTFIVQDRPFFIKDFFSAIQTHRVSMTAFVPYMAMMMANYPNPDVFDLTSLYAITISGAKTPPTVYQKLAHRFGRVRFINTYGMSEAGSRISIAGPTPCEFPIESVGKAIPGVHVRITDNNGNSLPANGTGEVEVKGHGVFKGYYNQAVLSQETIIDGWLKTGDLGRLDSQGNLYLVGRIKDIILCGGENINPSEIEETLLEHHAVREAAVIGIPDNRFEEVPCAFVVSSDEAFGEADIITFCRKRLSSNKTPRTIFMTQRIPRLGTSKVDRRLLKEMALNKLKTSL